jgi:hypothetical protein
MAKFIVLKNGMDHKVFTFDGNIARVGSGNTVDFQLETAGIEGDLFFIAKTPSGYEIERRVRDLAFTINGAAAGDRTVLNEGDKVGFLDYIMIVKYQPQEQPIPSPTPPSQPESVAPKGVGQGPATAVPTVESKPEASPPPEAPKPASKGSAKATMIIDSQALAAQAQQARSAPPPESHEKPATPPTPSGAVGTQTGTAKGVEEAENYTCLYALCAYRPAQRPSL